MSRSLWIMAVLVITIASLSAAVAKDNGRGENEIKHVLLISVDGMHSLDFVNCSHGVPTINSGSPYCPHLAELAGRGINYLNASASRPSDSFPGLMAIVTGGSPRTVGAFYDVAYDRVLAPPAKDTGNGLSAGGCKPGVANGTTTEYEEGIDKDQSQLNGGGDFGINSIDPARLPRDPFNACQPVFPWNFVRTNTIFGVVHQAGGFTAWSDKHPAYASVAGPGDGSNLNDFFSPEINSTVVALPVATPGDIGLGEIFFGPSITTMFNAPGLPPNGDPRTPDIIVQPRYGVVYTGSGKKQAEHGGFSHDDTNVILLLSHTGFSSTNVNTPVQTTQIAPTILRALGLNPNQLDAVRVEGTATLPAAGFSSH